MQHALSRALLALSLVAYGAAGQAQPVTPAESSTASATRIVLVASPGMDELANRFVAELRSLRFDVHRAPDAELAPTTPELEALALERRARAAVRVAAVGGSVDLWLVNPVSHEVIYRRVVSDQDPAVAVLRSLEILRGGLVDLHALSPRPEPKPPAATRSVDEPPRQITGPAPPRPPVTLGLAGAALLARAGRDVGPAALAALHYGYSSRFALHGEALVPLGEWSVEGAGGRAHVWTGGGLLAATVTPWGERRFSPGLGLGVGVLALHTRGEAQAGYRGATDLNLAAFPHGRLEASLKLAGPLYARAQLVAGFATPRPVLLFAEKRDTAWLNPLLLGSLGLELRLR